MNDSSSDTPASDAESAAERNSYLALSTEAMETMFGDESHADTMRILRGPLEPEARLVDATLDVMRAARRKVPSASMEIVLRVAGEVLEDAVAIVKAAKLFQCEPEVVSSARRKVIERLTN